MPPRGAEGSPHSSRHDLRSRGSLPSLVLPRDPDEQASYGLDRLQTTEIRERRNSVPDDFKPPRVPDLWEASQVEWERGRPDYLGVNAFEEIRRRLDDTLGERMSYDYRDPSNSGSQNTHDDGRQEAEEENVEPVDHSVEEPPPPPDDRHSWEVGRPDYMGRASFDFILKRMAATIGREEISATKKRKGTEAEAEGEDKENKKKSSSDDSESTPPPLIVPKRRVVLGSRGSVVGTASNSAVLEIDLPLKACFSFSGLSSTHSPFCFGMVQISGSFSCACLLACLPFLTMELEAFFYKYIVLYLLLFCIFMNEVIFIIFGC